MQDGIEEVKTLVASKAEGQLLRNIESEVARRFTSLEGALLKGLQAVSDKVAGALDLKVPITVCLSPSSAACCCCCQSLATCGRGRGSLFVKCSILELISVSYLSHCGLFRLHTKEKFFTEFILYC